MAHLRLLARFGAAEAVCDRDRRLHVRGREHGDAATGREVLHNRLGIEFLHKKHCETVTNEYSLVLLYHKSDNQIRASQPHLLVQSYSQCNLSD